MLGRYRHGMGGGTPLLGRDAERVRELFAGELVRTGRFDLSGTPEFAQAQQRFGIVSAASRVSFSLRVFIVPASNRLSKSTSLTVGYGFIGKVQGT